MKLYSPKDANHFVFAVVAKTAREGTAPTYVAIQAPDLELAEQQIDKKQHRPANPYVMGRYDDQGRYETYCPPVEGCLHARFVLHPFANDEMRQERGY